MHTKKLITGLVMIGLLFMTAGCQTGQQSLINKYSDDLELLEATLPNYHVGEYFSYDDGTTMVVTEVSKEQVTWQYDNGATSRGYRNFILPAVAWSSANSYGNGSSTSAVDLLWPLATGNQGQYESRQIISRKDRAESTELSRKWACTVEGTERVSVPAGIFDTYVIACKRYSSENNSWRVTRRFYYAPDLGYYVMRKDEFRSRPDHSRKLVDYGFNSTFLPEQDQIKLNGTLQKTLNRNPDGIASVWQSSSEKVAAMLIPVNSYTGLDGSDCREYHSVYSVQGRIRKNIRDVCRMPEGHWQRVD